VTPTKLSHHVGKMVTRQAKEPRKAPPEKVSCYQHDAGGALGVSMYAYTPTALSGYDSCIASDQSRRSGGVRA